MNNVINHSSSIWKKYSKQYNIKDVIEETVNEKSHISLHVQEQYDNLNHFIEVSRINFELYFDRKLTRKSVIC